MVKKVFKFTLLVSKTQYVYSLQLGKHFKTAGHKSPGDKGLNFVQLCLLFLAGFLKNRYIYQFICSKQKIADAV
jgi:hypothetical protein